MEKQQESARKYELTDHVCVLNSGQVKLRRIRALVTIPNRVTKGELGGFVEGEHNLSQEGKCWIGKGAMVYGKARVTDDAYITDAAVVFCYARVSGKALVAGKAQVIEHAVVTDFASVSVSALVRGHATVSDHAGVGGLAVVGGDARVCGNANVFGAASVSGNASVHGNAAVHGSAAVYGKASVYGGAIVTGNAKVTDYATVCGDVMISGAATIKGEAVVFGEEHFTIRGSVTLVDGHIESNSDYIAIGPVGSRRDFTTMVFETGTVHTGCFFGPLKEFKKAVRDKYNRDTKFYKEYMAVADMFEILADVFNEHQ